MTFSEKILQWYAIHKRDLPWRNTTDPYKIWLSEIILQQTRVAQGIPYYLKFLKHFPTVFDLANATEEEVLKLWQGLGYYSRARNLHATAKQLAHENNGKFPNSYAELLKLKGVGDYTASAIASICFGEAQAVVDGNVYRVLARYFGISLPINSTEGIKYFKNLALEVMNTGDIRDYNQGIMEFGAIQCAPKKPYCLHCPLKSSCVSLQKNTIHMLPVKINKTKIKKRYFNYIVISGKNGKTLVQQREGKGIWRGLYEFPLLETKAEVTRDYIEKELTASLHLNHVISLEVYGREQLVHKLSHQHLYTKFWVVKVDEVLENGITKSELLKFPVPVLIADFIKIFKF